MSVRKVKLGGSVNVPLSVFSSCLPGENAVVFELDNLIIKRVSKCYDDIEIRVSEICRLGECMDVRDWNFVIVRMGILCRLVSWLQSPWVSKSKAGVDVMLQMYKLLNWQNNDALRTLSSESETETFQQRLWKILAKEIAGDTSSLEAYFVASADPFVCAELCAVCLLGSSLGMFLSSETALMLEACALPHANICNQEIDTQKMPSFFVQSAKELSWLFHDSKITNRNWIGGDTTTDAKNRALIWKWAFALAEFRDFIDQIWPILKSEVRFSWVYDNVALGGETATPARFDKLQRTVDQFKGLSRRLTSCLVEFHRLSTVPFLNGQSAVPLEIEHPVATDLLGNSFDEFEQIFKLTISKPMEFSAAVGLDDDDPRPEPSSVADTLTQLDSLLKQSSSQVDTVLRCNAAKLYHANAQKVAKKKQNIGWKFNYGRGVEYYLTEIRQRLIGSDVSLTEVCKYESVLGTVLSPTNVSGRIPKTAKGCVDFEPKRMFLRKVLFEKLTSIFEAYGAVPIDTPVFELKEILMGKYGEDQKLIFDLKDQGGEQLSLRYDLTVPFARFCATNNVESLKRYHIGKVYRRDEPQVARGRFREFYQCDIDIAGKSANGELQDSEILMILNHTLNQLKSIVGDFQIRISHRMILDGMMQLCNVPDDKIRAISSSIDKLDKETWETVEAEMVDQKGLKFEDAQKIREFVQISGPIEKVQKDLLAIAQSNLSVMNGLASLTRTFEYLKMSPNKPLEHCIVDLSLARGLDYYTGIIYEAELLAPKSTEESGHQTTTAVGSIAAGGRYDNLIGSFMGKQVPAVGVSIGIERIFRLAEKKFGMAAVGANEEKSKGAKITDQTSLDKFVHTSLVDVFLIGIDSACLPAKIELSEMLRAADIKVGYDGSAKGGINKQLEPVLAKRIPLVVIFGEDELKQRTVNVRELSYNDESFPKSEIKNVPFDGLVEILKSKLSQRSTYMEIRRTLLSSDS